MSVGSPLSPSHHPSPPPPHRKRWVFPFSTKIKANPQKGEDIFDSDSLWMKGLPFEEGLASQLLLNGKWVCSVYGSARIPDTTLDHHPPPQRTGSWNETVYSGPVGRVTGQKPNLNPLVLFTVFRCPTVSPPTGIYQVLCWSKGKIPVSLEFAGEVETNLACC